MIHTYPKWAKSERKYAEMLKVVNLQGKLLKASLLVKHESLLTQRACVTLHICQSPSNSSSVRHPAWGRFSHSCWRYTWKDPWANWRERERERESSNCFPLEKTKRVKVFSTINQGWRCFVASGLRHWARLERHRAKAMPFPTISWKHCSEMEWRERPGLWAAHRGEEWQQSGSFRERREHLLLTCNIRL